MNMRTTVLAAMLVASPVASVIAQMTVADHLARGDSAREAMQSGAALQHYEVAVKVDSVRFSKLDSAALRADSGRAVRAEYYEALWKASREAVDLGEFNANKDEQTRLYTLAEQYARRAVDLNPQDAEGHFNLARSIGRNALRMGTRDRIKYAKIVRTEALAALKASPKHPGALHVMGVWNAEVMRLNGFSRMIAKNFLGGQIFGEANWDNAQRYLEEAVSVDPNRIVHRLDLGKVYLDRDLKDKAREQFETLLKAPDRDYNDKYYKRDAEQKLKSLQ
jgi:tetratricopeptide (TPR) repeat protein